MTQQPTLGFSILGIGHIGKLHFKNLVDGQYQLVSIIDEYLNLNHFETSPDVKKYKSLDVFLAEDLLTDIVIVATPNGLHVDQAIKCIEAGKHVLVEKPLALTELDAEKLLQLATAKNKRVFVSMQLRFSPIVQYVSELLKNNQLGNVFLIASQCFWNRGEAYYNDKEWHGTKDLDGGVLFTQFSHYIDILHYFFERLTPTHTLLKNYTHQDCTDFADSGIVNFKVKNKETLGQIIFTTATYDKNFESNITIIGEKGTIKIGGQYFNELLYFNVKEVQSPVFEQLENNFHGKLYEEIVSAIAKKKSSILDGKNAIPIVNFIQNVYTY